MKYEHRIFFDKAQSMTQVKDKSVDLVITSPPYPMIEMWDDIMGAQNPQIKDALENNRADVAFELMHKELDCVWSECFRVIKDGGFLCVNIGDATRTIKGDFRLFSNHSRIIQACINLGFANLPNIIWRKQTNAPNKFMGSGMLPCGAYITLEHEYILVFRKGAKREYKSAESKITRRKSSFFWEERNIWFSDVWELKGTKQVIGDPNVRERSAAFPLEIPYRIINMYSQRGDVVLDPFMGLGTTAQAAILLGRNCIGYEIDKSLKPVIENSIKSISIPAFNHLINDRFEKHKNFVNERVATKGALKYNNQYLNCPVMTGQETDLELHYITDIYKAGDVPLSFQSEYEDVSDMAKMPKTNGCLF